MKKLQGCFILVGLAIITISVVVASYYFITWRPNSGHYNSHFHGGR